MTINEKQDEIIDELSGLDDWMDRYAYIIDLGNSLPPIDEKLKTPSRIMRGVRAAYGSTPPSTTRGSSTSPPTPTQ